MSDPFKRHWWNLKYKYRIFCKYSRNWTMVTIGLMFQVKETFLQINPIFLEKYQNMSVTLLYVRNILLPLWVISGLCLLK